MWRRVWRRVEVSSFGSSWSRNSNWMVEGGVTVEFTLIYDLNPFFGSYPRSWVRSLTYREYKPRQTDSEYSVFVWDRLKPTASIKVASHRSRETRRGTRICLTRKVQPSVTGFTDQDIRHRRQPADKLHNRAKKRVKT